MDNLQRARVSLLIDGDDLAPEEITALLGAQPRVGVRKGDVFVGHHGEITARTGRWQFGDDWEKEPRIERQIVTLLGRLTPDLDVWKTVTSRYHCYISVGGYFTDWTGGITLEPHALMLMAERGLAIDFDLYAPAASDAENML
jgi:hypothetical protein